MLKQLDARVPLVALDNRQLHRLVVARLFDLLPKIEHVQFFQLVERTKIC